MGRWRIPWRWWLLVGATAGLALLALVVPRPEGRAAPSAEDFGRYTGVGQIGLVLVVVLVLVVNGLGEETGWRGFAADRLVGRLGVVGASLVVTLLWAGWHVPMFWVVDSFREFGPAGTVGWLLGLAAGSLVLTWLYLRTGRSILYVAAWHTAFNLTAATAATAGLVAAISSTLVMVAAAAIVVAEVRRRRAPERERGDDRSHRRGR
jgi:membrane protease YdiL (CAAX protease family)